jgi:hypothetical protein
MTTEWMAKQNANEKLSHPTQREAKNELSGPASLQRSAAGPTQADFAPPPVHQVLQTPGQPLDLETLGAMGTRFNHDFSRVRVHTDRLAALSAEAVHATAYTVGQHVVFARSQYAPGTRTGQQLLAHELAHVVQQKQVTPTAQIPLAPTDSPAERQAARAALHTGLPLGQTAFAIQRQPAQATAQQVTGITTPQPKNVKINQSGTTTQVIHGLEVIFELDEQSQSPSMKNRAETDFKFDAFSINYNAQKGKVTSFTGPGQPRVKIKTTYGSGVTSASKSGYGRGTTPADVKAGTTSLGFHEGSHGTDYLSYFQNNPFPQFTGAVGMSEKDFKAAMKSYQQERSQYSKGLKRFSELQTDCVGTTIDQSNAKQGNVTAICKVAP